ncbi:hypothetical protein Poli38472_011879 [Pythium oligandrum]|uniref:Uncharacterized protein n=1 Tax=Pythium oligandrum TaxID=41045 RepID=A0A8K1FDF7_PYTOL|nr:hypothetical protein Poli38472_011879 [Pythium oligandrum]|eukprot:TMW58291.1 hypothetical protein Poli38472_011879 [Pythium oligandrum]
MPTSSTAEAREAFLDDRLRHLKTVMETFDWNASSPLAMRLQMNKLLRAAQHVEIGFQLKEERKEARAPYSRALVDGLPHEIQLKRLMEAYDKLKSEQEALCLALEEKAIETRLSMDTALNRLVPKRAKIRHDKPKQKPADPDLMEQYITLQQKYSRMKERYATVKQKLEAERKKTR